MSGSHRLVRAAAGLPVSASAGMPTPDSAGPLPSLPVVLVSVSPAAPLSVSPAGSPAVPSAAVGPVRPPGATPSAPVSAPPPAHRHVGRTAHMPTTSGPSASAAWPLEALTARAGLLGAPPSSVATNLFLVREQAFPSVASRGLQAVRAAYGAYAWAHRVSCLGRLTRDGENACPACACCFAVPCVSLAI
jgi:hypothetical protein